MPERSVSGLDVLAFVAELAVLALVAVSGWRLSPSVPLGVVLAIALPLVFIAIWARWMAPRSAARLPYPGRFVGQAALFLASAAVAVAAGLAPSGLTIALGAIVVFGVTFMRDARTR